jgi:hypothetical protein
VTDLGPASGPNKRAKHSEETPQAPAFDFKQKIEEEFKHDDEYMRQEEECQLEHLYNLEKDFGTLSAIDYFRSDDARQPDSTARAMVESGRRYIKHFKPEVLARVVFAAIVIGGKTLTIYLNSFEELQANKRTQPQA